MQPRGQSLHRHGWGFALRAEFQQLRDNHVQVTLHAIETFVEGDAMDFADQLILSMRNKLRDYRPEDEQRSYRLHDCNQPCETDREDIAIADRGCGHEAKVQCAGQTVDAGAKRLVPLYESMLACQSAHPVTEPAQQDRSDPDQEKLHG